jgi:hypothetical protein
VVAGAAATVVVLAGSDGGTAVVDGAALAGAVLIVPAPAVPAVANVNVAAATVVTTMHRDLIDPPMVRPHVLIVRRVGVRT